MLNQNGTEIGIGQRWPFYGDPIIEQFIMGSGSDFTIVHHYRMWGEGALYNYPYVLLVSGKKDGASIKNLKMTMISLPYVWSAADKKGDGGEVVMSRDEDGVSELQ